MIRAEPHDTLTAIDGEVMAGESLSTCTASRLTGRKIGTVFSTKTFGLRSRMKKAVYPAPAAAISLLSRMVKTSFRGISEKQKSEHLKMSAVARRRSTTTMKFWWTITEHRSYFCCRG